VSSNKVHACDLSTAWNVFWRDGSRNSQVCATERGEFLMAFSRPKGESSPSENQGEEGRKKAEREVHQEGQGKRGLFTAEYQGFSGFVTEEGWSSNILGITWFNLKNGGFLG